MTVNSYTEEMKTIATTSPAIDLSCHLLFCNSSYELLKMGITRISSCLLGVDKPPILESIDNAQKCCQNKIKKIITTDDEKKMSLAIGQIRATAQLILKIVPEDRDKRYPEYNEKGLKANPCLDEKSLASAITSLEGEYILQKWLKESTKLYIK